MSRLDHASLVPCDSVKGEDPEDEALLQDMVADARSYITSFPWCRDVEECYVADLSVGGVVAVVLVRISPSREDVDEWLWLVVGDLPPAYLVTDDAPNPAAALRAYVDEMGRWVEAVRTGESTAELIPVETASGDGEIEPTLDHAADLDSRLQFLQRKFLKGHS